MSAMDADAEDAEWERAEAAWKAAYCASFREAARARGWTEEDIESGWLDDWPDAALSGYGIDACPREKGAEDVLAAEIEAANA